MSTFLMAMTDKGESIFFVINVNDCVTKSLSDHVLGCKLSLTSRTRSSMAKAMPPRSSTRAWICEEALST